MPIYLHSADTVELLNPLDQNIEELLLHGFVDQEVVGCDTSLTAIHKFTPNDENINIYIV